MIRFAIRVESHVHCSTKGCAASDPIHTLPLRTLEDGALRLDPVGLQAKLSEGWRVGSLRSGVIVPPGGSEQRHPPIPVVFCPVCAARHGRVG